MSADPDDTVPDDPARVTEPVTVQARMGRPAAARELAPGTALGRYRVIEPLGEGGMAVVYAAQDQELNRRVALKLLRTRLRSSAADARLLREAQALARLSHPNVVTVFDVGTTGDRIYLALELVDGATLRDWLADKPRTWREVLAVALAAGRGLAAAHAAGIIHRDFTPNNILVGSDGRVRVTDFGLARALDTPDERDSEPVSPDAPTEVAVADSGSSPLDAQLTEAGTLMGTPGYIAPEQYLGRPVDARTDQFTYCVTLYRALYGMQPFGTSSLEQGRAAVLAGDIPDPPDGSKVPARILRILKRGLSPEPDRRFASMGDLLSELERDPWARRRKWAARGALGVAVAGLVTGAFLLEAEREEPCRDVAHHLTATWNRDVARRARAAFTATGLPYAEKTWQASERLLDRWAGEWVDMRTEACEDTRVRHEHSEDVMTRRMVCLDRNAEEARALLRLLSEADAEMVKRAVGAVTELGSVRECADVQSLLAEVKPPADRAIAARVTTERTELANVRALFRAGRPGPAAQAARAAVAAARDIGYPPLLAEALIEQGKLEYDAGSPKPAIEPLRQALLTAEAARADDLVARAASELLMVYARGLADDAGGSQWADFAAAVIARLGNRPGDRVRLERGLAQLHAHAGRYDQAIEHQKLVLQLTEEMESADHPDVGSALLDLGNMYQFARQNDRALDAYQRALAILEKQMGREHPQTVAVLGNIANMYDTEGRHKEALALTREVTEILERTYGQVHGQVAIAHLNLGFQLGSNGLHVEAVGEMRRALDIGGKVYPTEHHPMMVAAELGLAAELRASRQLPESLEAARRGLATSEKAYGVGHPQTGFAFAELGETLMAMHREKAAVPALERAIALLVERKVSGADLAAPRFALAQAMWGSGGDRKRAVELAGAARAGWEEAGDSGREDATAVRAWLAAHRVD